MSEEWRLEVELDEERHGYSLGERLRSHSLDDEARERLENRRVIVTRDGSRIFVYADTEATAREAERVLRELLEADDLSADIWVSRWHPDAETWKDAAEPMPQTEADRIAEYRGREAAALERAERTGEMPFEVRVDLPKLTDALTLVDETRERGYPVERRWRHVLIGAPTEERAAEIAAEIRPTLPEGTEVEVEASGVRFPFFSVLGWSS
ncbi:MAG TPA: hypothetical protein VFY99_08955 [Solirubrobacterales bacterium]